MTAPAVDLSQYPHGVRFSYGRWLERYLSDGLHAEPVTTRDPGKARRFDTKAAADEHIAWAGWGPDEATAEPLPMNKPGDHIDWASGPGGLQGAKRGRCIAILPAGGSLRAAIAAAGRKPVRIMAGERAKSDRYVVEVSSRLGPMYYAPLIKTVDLDLRRTQQIRTTLAHVEAR